MDRILKWVIVGLFLRVGAVQAQDFFAGVHVGALGSTAESSIGYGAHFGVNPYGFAAFQVDVSTSSPGGGTYFSSSPALILYPIYMEEFLVGVMAGAGFYKHPSVSTRFGLNFGVTGDFRINNQLSFGMETRFHPVFSADNVWNVFLTMNYHFEGDGGW